MIGLQKRAKESCHSNLRDGENTVDSKLGCDTCLTLRAKPMQMEILTKINCLEVMHSVITQQFTSSESEISHKTPQEHINS